VVTVPRSSLGTLGVFVSVSCKFPTVEECDWVFCDPVRIRLNRDASFKTYKTLYFAVCSTVERNVLIRADFHGFASESIQKALQERKRSVDVFARHLARQQAKQKEATPADLRQVAGPKRRFLWKPLSKNFVRQNKQDSAAYPEKKAESMHQSSQSFASRKRAVLGRRQELQEREKQKHVFEVTKSDLKKGMKKVLVHVLSEREAKEAFARSWLALLAFGDFHQTVAADVREARAQFSEYLRVTTLMQLYISSFCSKVASKGEDFAQRQLTAALQ